MTDDPPYTVGKAQHNGVEFYCVRGPGTMCSLFPPGNLRMTEKQAQALAGLMNLAHHEGGEGSRVAVRSALGIFLDRLG